MDTFVTLHITLSWHYPVIYSVFSLDNNNTISLKYDFCLLNCCLSQKYSPQNTKQCSLWHSGKPASLIMRSILKKYLHCFSTQCKISTASYVGMPLPHSLLLAASLLMLIIKLQTNMENNLGWPGEFIIFIVLRTLARIYNNLITEKTIIVAKRFDTLTVVLISGKI